VETDTIFARYHELKNTRVNVTGMQGDRNVINPVLAKYLPAYMAGVYTAKWEWTYAEVEEMINTLTNGRPSKAKTEAVNLLRAKIGPITARIEAR
jgi:hypothetical protein